MIGIEEIFSRPCPCDTCPMATKCGEEKLACMMFGNFAIGMKAEGRRGSLDVWLPTREIYAYIFSTADNDSAYDEKKKKFVEKMPKINRVLLNAAINSCKRMGNLR